MHFLVYSISFSPEKIGSGKYNGELVDWLITSGHAVDVVTTYPYYPEWKVSVDDKGKGWSVERNEKLTIYRVPCFVPQNPSTGGRIIQEITFFLSSSIILLKYLFSKKVDIYFCMSPPLLTGVPGIIIGKIKSIPVWYHVQDLQLDAAKDLGMIRSRLLLQSLERIERWIFRNATYVSSISEGMKKQILAKGVRADQYVDFPNWADTDKICPLPKEQIPSLRTSFGLPIDQSIILYSGNLGEKQGVEILVQVAVLSQTQNWLFLIAGDGAYRKQLEAEVNAQGLANIQFRSLVDYAEFSNFLNCADVHLIIQKKSSADNALPSKLSSISSVGGLIVATSNTTSSLASTIQKHQSGLVVEPENPEALHKELVQILHESSDKMREVYKTNARAYAVNNLGINAIMQKFVQVCKTIVSPNND